MRLMRSFSAVAAIVFMAACDLSTDPNVPAPIDPAKDSYATSLEIDMDSFDLTPFTNEGGLARASKVFGKELKGIVQELNEALAA